MFDSLPRDTSIAYLQPPYFDPVIRPNDLLNIQVSSLNKEMDDKFNAASTVSQVGGDMHQSNIFPVDTGGNILVHYVGKVRAAGLTRQGLAAELQKGLETYMKEPIVQVQILSHKVTVMGEVKSPKVLTMPQAPMTVFDALAGGGDLTENADRTNIIVLRDSSGNKLVKHLNLERHDYFSTSWLYLQPNDIVYVKSTYSRLDKEERRRNLQTTLSLVATGVSLITVLLTRFIK